MVPGWLMKRVVFTLCAIVVYRFGLLIPLPGIDPLILRSLFPQGPEVLFSGAGIHRLSIFSLGLIPYISAAVLVQLARIVSQRFRRLEQQGDHGRQLLERFTLYLTLLLAALQAFGIAHQLQGIKDLLVDPGSLQIVSTVVTLTGGVMLLVWLSRAITLRGVGNGVAVILLAGSVSDMPAAFAQTLQLVHQGVLSQGSVAALAVIIVYVVALVVGVELAEREIPIRFNRHSASVRALLGQSPNLSLKLYPAGAMIPVLLTSWVLGMMVAFGVFLAGHGPSWWIAVVRQLQPGQPIHLVFYALLIIFFTFYYTAFLINPTEMAESLARLGGTMPSIPPDGDTREYVDGVVSRITVIGAAYLLFVCLVPEVLARFLLLPFSFGGPPLLILVCAMLDIYTQVRAEVRSVPRA